MATSWATASISPRGSRASPYPGAICLSEQAYWQVKGRLDLKVTDLGPTQLKNKVASQVSHVVPRRPARCRPTWVSH